MENVTITNAGRKLASALTQTAEKKASAREFTFYIAFSVHGSHAFITATKKIMLNVPESNDPSMDPKMRAELENLGKHGFRLTRSRRPGYNSNVEMKLHWDRLTTQEGKPLRSAPIVLQRFKELEALGFVVNKESFVQKHYH